MTATEPADGEAHVAVIGMAVRFGEAAGPDAYREQLRTPGGADTRRPLADPYAFDSRFFGISPREATVLDPQQRVLLECAHHALEDAAHDPSREDQVVGIYAGGSTTSHAALLRERADLLAHVDDRQVRAATGADFLAARAAYKLGLTGPAVSVQAAGATALVAVHTAVQALLGGECDVALAGAVTVRADADARGATGGCAVVVLKPLADALEDGDRIHAVVRGTAVGRSRPGESGPDGRARIARDARRVGDVAPGTVAAVDTPPGDGVTDVAPAMAAFVRAVLCVQDGTPPADGTPPPDADRSDAEGSDAEGSDAEGSDAEGSDAEGSEADGSDTGRSGAGRPRRAGLSVSAPFGLHAHVVVEQPPAPRSYPSPPEPEESPERGAAWQLLPLSAKTPTALADTAARLAHHLQDPRRGGAPLRDVARTLQTGRTAHAHRAWVVARDAAEAAEALAGLKIKERSAHDPGRDAPPVVFTFPGHGGQHMGMARQLYRTDPLFRADVDAGARHARAEAGLDLRAVLDPEGEKAEEQARHALSDGAVAQLAVFVLEHALARAFIRWGVRPAAVVGHSLGGYAAACVAGVFSFPDALRMVVRRTRLLLSLAPGAMAAVRMPEEELLPLLPAGVDIGAISGPDQVTISGPRTPVERFVEEATAEGLEARLLKIPGAGHSSLVEPLLGDFAAFLETVEFHAPRIPVISDTTGTWASPDEITTPAYWCAHMRRTVRYHDVLETLSAYERCALLEVGPGTTLTALARRHGGLRHGRHAILQALPHPTDPTPDMKILLSALGALWAAGADVTWAALPTDGTPRRTGLPGHPLQRAQFPLPAN
ncbi:type I polyketide synthase [Streptomyces sp. TRM49041]|uniref:acyltransferase domain-containing protein n=1 Tax=Streptomyces sp. TRM49041 TaxID=2603216 RepID=UPI0011F08AB2|nr:type I polyketide synthase [Streptomyces sp. TRM49041]